MLTILNKYLLRQNIYLILIILFSGIAIYLIVDFLTRMNAIVESGVGLAIAARYFAFKIPLIVTQLMPAIFMLAVIIQIAIMYRSNEMIALESNSISFFKPAVFFIFYSVAAFLVLLAFSETMGIRGYQETKTIWDADIRQRQVEDRGIDDLWFREGQTIVFVDKAWPGRNEGKGLTVYEMDGPDTVKRIIKAPEFKIAQGTWILSRPEVTDMDEFQRHNPPSIDLFLETELSSFSIVASRLPYDSLSIFTLKRLITQLEERGSNVERMATAMQSKVSYPFALVVMTILGLAMATLIRNIYALVVLALVIVFLYYTVYVFGISYAEEGMIPPFLGAWLANILFGILGLGQIVWAEKS
ncbi:MAG: LptF/LptG family permease [Desulfovibrionales bacterium]|nr:LptF/LptG family permease [Desulfovibrionales bacterium]